MDTTAVKQDIRMDIFDKAYKYKDAEEARAEGIYPYFRVIESDQDAEVTMNGQRILMMGSNSYLGLTNHPYVKQKSKDAVDKYGTGCAGSRFLNGTLDIHIELEERLAKLVGKEACLVYATGYQANLGAITAIAANKTDVVLTDKLDHASIVDATQMAWGTTVRYNHSDMNHLERMLKANEASPMMIVTDGVFSMEGDIAKMPDLVFLAKKYGARLLVDDAHSVGVLGKTGGGTGEHFGLTDDIDIIVGTFSKSLASVGGYVAGDAKIIDFIKHNSRPLIFSASLPPASAGAVIGALDIMEREPERFDKLWDNTHFMMDGLKSIGYDIGISETPIVPIVAGEEWDAFRMWRMLQDANIFVNPAVPPAVPKGQCLIRTSYMATHTKEQLQHALDKFEEVGKTLKLI